jgi:hypothetical protein
MLAVCNVGFGEVVQVGLPDLLCASWIVSIAQR